ncbi:ATP-dependent DNA helicase PIF1 [Tanacetum coccineum]|uniref:ATP-dependent DNA helicase PIF1 n=1 Tax=Tanacetum coccineum TaxID=301880 RepID=A0ABQ5AAK0_9ASTR
MRRGGYAHVKEKMIEKKEIKQDEEPTRGTLWLKGRVNKDGEYQDDKIRSVGDKLKETGDKIKEGTLQVDQGTDAMTLVLGKEKGGYARGVGSGVTYKSQLDAARREREEKELLIKSMSSKMSQTEGMVSPVEIHPINSSADEEGKTTVVGCDQNDASIWKEIQKRETVKSVGAKYTTRSIRKDSSSQDSQSKENVSVLPQAIKCILWHLKKTTIIAEGTVYKSDGKIMLHNKALPKDCYKVSIDKSLVHPRQYNRYVDANEFKSSMIDRTVNPTLSNMINKAIFLTSNTIIGKDGKVHSYCGLRLVDIPASSAGVLAIYHNLGPPSYECFKCNATMWYNERSDKARKAVTLTFSLCCQEGKVLLPRFNDTYQPLMKLLDYDDTTTPRFKDQIRNEIRNRMSAFMSKETPETIDKNIVASLIQILDHTSAMAKSFRMAKEWCHLHSDVNFGLRLLSEKTTTRQYNTPTVFEVAALIINYIGYGLPTRDIVVNKNNTGLQCISELHPSYIALQYPLLFPFGKDGYHEKIPYHSN